MWRTGSLLQHFPTSGCAWLHTVEDVDMLFREFTSASAIIDAICDLMQKKKAFSMLHLGECARNNKKRNDFVFCRVNELQKSTN